MNLQIRSLSLAILVSVLVACEAKKQPDTDYVVPKDVDVIQVCEKMESGLRQSDSNCEANREGYRWMYDKRSGHLELPAVGERVYHNEFSADRPSGVKIDRLPENGGWWEKLYNK